MAVIALSWCVMLGLYLLFAGQVSVTELSSAVALATLATGWSLIIRRCAKRTFCGWRSHWRPVLLGIRHLVPATLQTGAVLMRVVTRGGSPATPVHYALTYGEHDDPRDRARRATAVLVASLAPDSFVIRLVPGRSEALLHSIVGSGAEPDPRWLI